VAFSIAGYNLKYSVERLPYLAVQSVMYSETVRLVVVAAPLSSFVLPVMRGTSLGGPREGSQCTFWAGRTRLAPA
jgi:hypothetical protein